MTTFEEKYKSYQKRATSSNGGSTTFDKKYQTYKDRTTVKEATKTSSDAANLVKQGFQSGFNGPEQQVIKKPTTSKEEFNKFDAYTPTTPKKPTTSKEEFNKFDAYNPDESNIGMQKVVNDLKKTTTFKNMSQSKQEEALKQVQKNWINQTKIGTNEGAKTTTIPLDTEKWYDKPGNLVKGAAKGALKGATDLAGTAYDNLFSPISQYENILNANLNHGTDKQKADLLKQMDEAGYTVTYDQQGKAHLQNKITNTLDKASEALTTSPYAPTSEKIGNTVGSIAEQVGQMGMIWQGTSKLGGNISNEMLKRATQSAALGASNAGLNAAKQELDNKDTVKEMVRGGLFFGAGSLGSQAAGGAIENALIAKGMQNSTKNYVLEQLAKGAAFSAAGEAATYPTYPLMGDETPSIEQIGTTMLTGMIFDTVSGLVALPKIKANSKAVLDQSSKQLVKGLEILETIQKSNADQKTKNTVYENVLLEINRTRGELNNSRLVGEEVRVNQYNQILDFVENDIKKQLASQYVYRQQTELGNTQTNLIGKTPTGAAGISNQSRQALTGKENLTLENSRPYYGDAVGKPYTNLPSRVINQAGNKVQSIGQLSQSNQVKRNEVGSIDNTSKKENLTEAKIEQNNNTPLKNVAYISGEVQELGNKALNDKINELNPQEKTVYKIKVGDKDKYVNVFPSPETGERMVSILHGAATKPYEKLETIDLTAKEEVTNTKPKTIAEWREKAVANVDYETVKRSLNWSSFDPEGRAKRDIESLNRVIQDVAGKLEQKYSENMNEQQEAALIDELENFKTGLEKRFNAMVSAESRVASPAVTGPAKFNYAKNEKALNAHHNKQGEYIEYYENAVKVISKKLNRLKGEEELTNDALKEVRQDTEFSLRTILEGKKGERAVDVTLIKQNLQSRTGTRAGKGEVEAVQEIFNMIKDFENENKVTVFTNRSSFWNLLDRAKEVKTKKEVAAEKTKEALQNDRVPEHTTKLEKHTKTGADLHVVRFNERFTPEQFKEMKEVMKSYGGSYSSFKKGFIFDSEPGFDIKPVEAPREIEVAPNEEIAKTGPIESGETVIFKSYDDKGHIVPLEGTVKEIDTLYNEAAIDVNGKTYYIQESDLKRAGESLEALETKEDKLIRMEDKYSEPTVYQRANDLLSAQETEIEATRTRMEAAEQVVDIIKEGKKGRSSKKYYLSPELAGVDNIKSLSSYMSFTDDPKATSLDVMQMEVANVFPEVGELGLEEFGQWLVDNVDSYRTFKETLKEQELTYDETFKKLKIDTKTMGDIEAFKQAVEEIEKDMKRMPFSLQFFSQKTVDSYKTLIKQLEREGVSKALVEEVKQLGQDFKAAEAALKREKERSDKAIDKLVEKQKDKASQLKEKTDRTLKTSVERERMKAALEKEDLTNKYQENKQSLIEKAAREKSAAVAQQRMMAALEKENIQEKAYTDKMSLKEELTQKKNAAVAEQRMRSALEKEDIQEKAYADKVALKEKLTRKGAKAVAEANMRAALEKDVIQKRGAKALKEEKIKRQIDRFKVISKENRQEVRKKYKELVKIAKERQFKMNPETKAAVNELMNFIQGKQIGEVSQLDKAKFNVALDKLATYEDIPISNNLKTRLEAIKTTTDEMTYDDFMEVYNMTKIIVSQNKYVNKLMTTERYRSIKEAVEEVKKSFTVKHKKLGRGVKVEKNGVTTKANHLIDKVALSQLTIKNLCAKIEGTQGGALKTVLYDNIVKGHTVKYAYLKKSMDFFSSKLEKVDLKAIDKGTYDLTDIDGDVTRISSLEKIAIALNSFNEKNRYALVNGGVVRKNASRLIKIDDTEIETLVASLNANEKQIVETVLEYFETLNQEQINALTMKMFNYEGAKEKGYYPKKVAKSYTRVNETHTLEEESGLSHLSSGNLENAGFLKPKTLTKTPISLENPFEVVFQMMNDTAELSAYAPALRDARLMLRKLQPFITENYSDVMYRELADYVTAMNKPNNIRVESDDMVNTLYNNVVTAVFGLNVSTSAKQPLGLINAATEIEGKYLLRATTVLPGQMKNEVEKIYEYAPYLWYRGQGNVNRDLSETNIHKGINKTFYGKKSLRDYATYHITKTDMYVALRIWKACEYKVKTETKLKPGTDEFYKKVGEMATEITLTTQGNGEVTHRSQLMRSDNIWKKSFTAFQNQAQTCYNQLDSAYEEFKETKRLARFARKALLISIIPAIGGVAISELIKLGMGNDKNIYTKYKNAKDTGVGMEEVAVAIQEKLLSEIMGINLYTGITYDAIKSANNFYGADSNNPLYRELQNLAQGVAYLQNGKADKAFETISSSLLKLTAIPVDNIKKIATMGNALVNGYNYDLTDKETFNAYKSEINSFSNELEKEGKEPTKEQAKVIKKFNSYKYDIGKLEKAIEEAKDESKKQRYHEKLEETIQKANDYFIENQQLLD